MSETRTSSAARVRARKERDRSAVRAALAELREKTGVLIVFGGIVTDARTLQVCEGIGLTQPHTVEVDVHPGAGVGGRVVASGKPFGVSEYIRSGVISHEYDKYVSKEGIRSLAAIPVIVHDVVRVVLYVAMRTNVRFGEKVLAEMMSVGRRLEQHIAVADALEDTEHDRGVRYADGTPASLAKMTGRTHTDRSADGFDAALIHERMRETHAKLRVLASSTEDPLTRMELESIAAALVAPSSSAATAKLSRRELDVLACVAQGKTNIETGQIMGIGAETVKSYLRSAMRKLDAHTRYEAVNAARRIGALP